MCIKFQPHSSTHMWVIVIFAKCVRRTIRRKKQRKFFESLIARISRNFSNLECDLPWVEGTSVRKFGVIRIRHHGATYAWKLRLYWSCEYTSPFCVCLNCFLGPHNALLYVLILHYRDKECYIMAYLQQCQSQCQPKIMEMSLQRHTCKKSTCTIISKEL